MHTLSSEFWEKYIFKVFKNILLHERHSTQVKSKSIQPEKLYSKYLHNEIFHSEQEAKPSPKAKYKSLSHRALNDEI
jgi:hypothetical protein